MLGGKWRLLILYAVHERDGARYSDIKNQIPEISDKVLSNEFRSLEQNRLLMHTDRGNEVHNGLTPIGCEAVKLIKPNAKFGEI